ncbi:MAG: UDP-N-acetylmuramoyl-tripeptide--D-alanyl-D-alanine ligase [Candidatus Magasanikbacteria bacterium]|nr:UDP-N-acetylmuramoyl-tripeptide--D-alanyl-D-alanine ligase [Candidatus Magasanikbacteria bacterium]
MFSPINWIIFFLWALSAVIDYSEFCYIWQLKEYRWDRFRDFLSTKQGRTYWVKYRLLWRSLVAIVIFFWPINSVPIIKYILIMLFAVDLSYNALKLYRSKLVRPKYTVKAMAIIIFAAGIEGAIFLIARDWILFLVLLIVRFLILTVAVLLLTRAFNLYKRYMVLKASRKLLEYPNLLVVGVTGSYGKSTVKKFLHHILEPKYHVIRTPRNINTEIGVAQFVLSTNLAGVEIFIVEMGAYRIGEIALICGMVKPKIGILTAINEQHLSLFGDIKKTQQAKYELLRSLPADGLAVINADNFYCREKVKELKCNVLSYGTDETRHPDCLIKEARSNLDGISFIAESRGKEHNFSSPIVGEHNIMNIAPCLLVAEKLEVSDEAIGRAVATLPPSLKIFKYGECDIIDDSYNSNPDGFRAALDVLNKYPTEKKRIIITRGMLELGEKSDEIHERIGEEISIVADELVIITEDFVEPLGRGVAGRFKTTVVLKLTPADLLAYLQSLKKAPSVILLENRIPDSVMAEIK